MVPPQLRLPPERRQAMVSFGQVVAVVAHELLVEDHAPPDISQESELVPVAPAGVPEVEAMVAEVPTLAEFPTAPEHDAAPWLQEMELGEHPVIVTDMLDTVTPAGYLFPAESTPAA